MTLYLSKLSYYSYEISQLNLQQLAGAVIYLGLKTVEQHENIVAENFFDFII